MMLLVDGPLTITNGTVSEDVYNARIELMGSAVGTWSGSPVEYDVEAGDAVFLVAGEADGEYVTLAVTNSTAISASELTGGEWSFGSFEFEIEYIDDSTNIWTVAVNASNWLE